jgi:electron transfer flavoprotein alpha subunit
METILFLAHTDENGALAKATLEVLSAAADLKKQLPGSKLIIGLIGCGSAAAAAMAGCGAEKFYEVSGTDFTASRYASDAAAIESIFRAAKPTLVLAAATARFSRSIPGITQRVQGRIDTHVGGFSISASDLKIQRWYYRQRMLATVSRSTRPWFLIVDSGVFTPWQGAAAAVAAEKLDVKLPDSLKKTKVIGLQAPSADAQTIRPDAKLLFVAGVGWTKKQPDGQLHTAEAAKLIADFLSKSKASLGSSKSLVDQSSEGQAVFSFMSHLNQVGQTGTTPRHPKGLATCCHGEEPHVVGWRFINDRRAVNLDPNCGWAQGKTDVLYVADAFKVMARVNELLAAEQT